MRCKLIRHEWLCYKKMPCKLLAEFDVLWISWCVILGFSTGLLSPLDVGAEESFLESPVKNGILNFILGSSGYVILSDTIEWYFAVRASMHRK